VKELDVELETKTQDNVFVKLHVAVQYQVMMEEVYSAFYLLGGIVYNTTFHHFALISDEVVYGRLADLLLASPARCRGANESLSL
jgi:regulator of protease activity HflC (stomatin/prohibitin superfamily)